MRILVHNSPTTLEPLRSPALGVLCSPRRLYGAELVGWTWAADNDAYSEWNADRYRAMLSRIWYLPPPLFVTAPDVVSDARATLERFREWSSALEGLPIAFVLQDGVTRASVPWSEIAAVFVGGSSEFKLSLDAARLVADARERGLLAHMGRVNSHRRLRHAKAIGCTSIDGSGFGWFRGDGEPKRDRDRDRLRKFLAHAEAPSHAGILV